MGQAINSIIHELNKNDVKSEKEELDVLFIEQGGIDGAVEFVKSGKVLTITVLDADNPVEFMMKLGKYFLDCSLTRNDADKTVIISKDV